MTYVAFVVGEDGKIVPPQRRSLDQTDELAALWEIARQKKGPLRDNSPFRCVKCKEVVYWRQPVSRDPHFYHARSSKCSLSKAGSKLQHQRIQSALLRVGEKLGEIEAGVEYPAVDDQGRPRFFDVVWPSREIAWEVDLTINPKSEQQFRQKLRSNRKNLTMISLVCAQKLKKQRIQDFSIPTIVVRGLSTKVEKSNGISLEWAVAHRVLGLRRLGNEIGFYKVNICFIDFVKSMDEYKYGQYTGINNGKLRGWAKATEIKMLENYLYLTNEIRGKSNATLQLENELRKIYKNREFLVNEQEIFRNIEVIVNRLRSHSVSEIRAALSELHENTKSKRICSELGAIIEQAVKIANASAVRLYMLPFWRKSNYRDLLNKINEYVHYSKPEHDELTNRLFDIERNISDVKNSIEDIIISKNIAASRIGLLLDSVREARINC